MKSPQPTNAEEHLFSTTYAPGIVYLLKALANRQRGTYHEMEDQGVTYQLRQKLFSALRKDLIKTIAEVYGLATLEELSKLATIEKTPAQPEGL